jgi:hypothetical protein
MYIHLNPVQVNIHEKSVYIYFEPESQRPLSISGTFHPKTVFDLKNRRGFFTHSDNEKIPYLMRRQLLTTFSIVENSESSYS